MDFFLSSGQSCLVAQAKKSASFFDHPVEIEAFASGANWRACADAGWAGLCLPQSLGGGGHGALDSVLAFEELGRSGASRGALFATGAHLFGCGMALANHANESTIDRWGHRLAAGTAVGGLALSEPSGGSDLANATTTFTKAPNGYVLNGSKAFVTNGLVADVLIVSAIDPENPAAMGTTTFVVSAKTQGLRTEGIGTGTGLRGTAMAKIHLDKCVVSKADVLGRIGGGMGIILSMMQWERTCILAGALGALDRDFRAVVAVLTKRRDSKGPLVRHQAVAHRLAEVRRKIEASRWLMYRAAWELDAGGDPLLYPSLSKLTVSETLVECATMLQSLMGGEGWANTLGLSQSVQDALAMATASGTADIQRNTIATRLTK
jgi:alkylation response protein AidB-like acyl-CoA dehydrogenase